MTDVPIVRCFRGESITRRVVEGTPGKWLLPIHDVKAERAARDPGTK